MRIELHTQLHSGIYASHGGGEDVIVKTFKASHSRKSASQTASPMATLDGAAPG